MPNARDQRRRADGAPLADGNLSSPGSVLASGVTTRDDRRIAWLDNLAVHILAITDLEDGYFAALIINEIDDSIITLANPETV